MKTTKNIFILVIITAICTFPACSDDEGTSVTIDEKLAGSWSLSSVRVNGSDATGDFGGFGITLNSSGPNSSQGSYTINGGYDILSGSGSYSISSSSSLNISPNSGNSVTASIQLSNNDQTLSFTFSNPNTTFGGGRSEGLAGEHVFLLSK